MMHIILIFHCELLDTAYSYLQILFTYGLILVLFCTVRSGQMITLIVTTSVVESVLGIICEIFCL